MAEPTVIHIVDDDLAVRTALGRLIRALGFDHRSYGAGEDLLVSGSIRTADLLLVDIGLPGMSGWELCKRLTASGIEVPVVLMTGHEDDEKVSETRLSTVAGVLRKPFGCQELREAIEWGLKPGRNRSVRG